MSKLNIEEFDFCYNQCKYRNYYDGWCHYHDEDADFINECEYCKKQIKKLNKKIVWV